MTWPAPEERLACTRVMGGRGIIAHLGLRSTGLDTEAVAVEMDIREDLQNNAGMLQGGVIMTLIDVCGGMAAARTMETMRCFTSDLTTHFLNGGKVGPARAEARVLRAGRTSCVVEVRVIDLGAEDRLMSVATMTMVKPSRPD